MLITICKTSAEQDQEDFKALEETGFYGRQGAGGLLFCTKTKRYLLLHRSRSVEQPNTWGIAGGAISEGEKPLVAVNREIEEELGMAVHGAPKLIHIFRSGTFSYFNYLIKVKEEFRPVLNWETQNYGWFLRNNFPTPLHFGVQELIDKGAI